jgi:hypothetical protein
MDVEIRKEFPHKVRVNLEGFRKYKGHSDLVTTYCCSATPCYFVVFPGIEYEGYFDNSKVEIISGSCQSAKY